MESSFSRLCTVDSYVSRRFPIFHLPAYGCSQSPMQPQDKNWF
jgi:hypothetical protein